MTCMAPTNEIFHPEKYFPMTERIGWVRKGKHCLEEFYSDEDVIHDNLDRLKEIHDLSMRATLLNAEHRYSDESITPNNRKRRIAEYNSSPDNRNDYHACDDGRYRLTLSQFAVSASEQEPLYPDDEDVEEILMRLRHGHDYYRPQVSTTPPPPSFPSILFSSSQISRPTFYSHSHSHSHSHMDQYPTCPPVIPTPNKASLFHILSQEPDNVNSMQQQLSVNNIHMRKLFFEEGLMESSDELDLEHPKKKVRRDVKAKSPMKTIINNNNDDVQEKETIAAGLCFKTHKPKVQREYYYAKLSKTIFRWTCCGSQAKTHPDA